jgi:hypothetical protein
MSNNHPPLIKHNHLETVVEGIREEVRPSDVRIYKANPDGSKGELKEIVPLEHYTMFNFNRSRFGGRK